MVFRIQELECDPDYRIVVLGCFGYTLALPLSLGQCLPVVCTVELYVQSQRLLVQKNWPLSHSEQAAPFLNGGCGWLLMSGLFPLQNNHRIIVTIWVACRVFRLKVTAHVGDAWPSYFIRYQA